MAQCTGTETEINDEELGCRRVRGGGGESRACESRLALKQCIGRVVPASRRGGTILPSLPGSVPSIRKLSHLRCESMYTASARARTRTPHNKTLFDAINTTNMHGYLTLRTACEDILESQASQLRCECMPRGLLGIKAYHVRGYDCTMDEGLRAGSYE